MNTIKKEKLKFASLKMNDGSQVTWYFKDITLEDQGDLSVNILYCSYDDIEGEPDFPVKIVE